MKKIIMGNDEFILYVRKQNSSCKLSTAQIGKLIWEWLRNNDNSNSRQTEKDMPCLWDTNTGAKNISSDKLPKTATQFEFNRELLSDLYDYLDKLS